jgi:hypothetical protein
MKEKKFNNVITRRFDRQVANEADYPEQFEPFTSTLMQGRNGYQLPTTPVIHHRNPLNSPGSVSSPRIQMYRTRVVYNDARPSSAGARVL